MSVGKHKTSAGVVGGSRRSIDQMLYVFDRDIVALIRLHFAASDGGWVERVAGTR